LRHPKQRFSRNREMVAATMIREKCVKTRFLLFKSEGWRILCGWDSGLSAHFRSRGRSEKAQNSLTLRDFLTSFEGVFN
jgi:hypothetical protein